MKVRFDQLAINVKEKKKPTEEDRHHYIGLEHLDSGSLTVSRWGADVAPKGEKLLMKKGDVLFGKRRAYQKKVAIAPFDGIFSAHGMVLRPNERIIDKAFFPLFISSDYFLDAAIALSVGSLSPTINWKDLARLEFELPSLEKQHELAEVLWAIEDTRTAYQRLEEATDELVKARFIEMFGREERSNTKSLAEISEVIAGGDKPKDTSERMTEEYCYPVYANGVSDKGLQCFSKEYRVDKYAVTISARGTIGATFIRKPYFTPVVRLIAIIPNKEINVTYLKYAIDTMGVKSNGSSQQQLTIPNLKEEMIAVPALSKQLKFAQFVEQTDKAKLAVQSMLEKNAAMKAAVMRELMR